MKPALIIGIIFIVFGVTALAFRGFTYTKREQVLKIGPVEATTETKETVPIPRTLGIAAIVGGAWLVYVGTRKNA